MEEKFILVSLEEDKSKKIAEIISNESCRKILDFLGEVNEASESEISEKLKIPISTVHYNIQQLVHGGLVESKEFRWSERGREINIYRLAKKYVVIAPKGVTGLRERLKGVLPVLLISLGISFLIQWFIKSKNVMFYAGSGAEDKALMAAPAAIQESTGLGANINIVQAVPNYGLWFFIGCLFALGLYLIFKRRR